MNSTHNKDLSLLLQKISDKVGSASSGGDLVEAIGYASAFGAPLKYDNRIPHAVAAFSIGIAVLVALLSFVFEILNLNEYSVGGMIILVVAACIAIFISMSRSDSISSLSSEIFYKDLMLDNGLKEKKDKSYLSFLKSNFNEFDRGNHSREFRKLLVGHYSGDEHSFEYHFYHFHYVNSRTVVETVSDGKGGTRIQTKTVYDHYDRYGIVMPFNLVKSLAILGAGGTGIKGYKYRPASNTFNKRFDVYADSEMDAAKFLKPKIVVECEDLSSKFSGLNYEFNKEGQLCFSFEDDDLIWANREHGIDSPEEFLEEINAHTQLPKLNAALNHIQTLMKYSDNNFMEKSA